MKKITIFLFFLCIAMADNVQKIQIFIKSNYEKFYKNNDLKVLGVDLLLSASSQIDEVKLKEVAFDDDKFSSDGVVRIVFFFKGKEYMHHIKYRVNANLKVVFAKNGIKKTQDITNENTSIKTVLLDSLQVNPISLKDINSTSAKIFIPNGTIIAQHHIESKILIRKNDSFLAIYKEGRMQIQLILVAKEDGIKNAVIEAINPETKKTLRVRILANATGEIL